MSQWISPSERHKDGRQYVLKTEDGTIQVGHWCSAGWAYGGGCWPASKVVRLMEIPDE